MSIRPATDSGPPNVAPRASETRSQGNDTVSVRRMGLADLSPVVAAHRVSFPHGFFARLGPRFLARYYRTFLDGPLAVAVVAEENGEPCGYLVGMLDPTGHRKLVLRYHGRSLAMAAGLAMLTRPRTTLTFLTTRVTRYRRALRRTRRSSAGTSDAVRAAVLSHVVVSEASRNRGIGSALVDEFLAQARAARCTSACLVTLDGPAGAGEFYRRIGWTRSHDRTSQEGQVLAYYTIELS